MRILIRGSATALLAATLFAASPPASSTNAPDTCDANVYPLGSSCTCGGGSCSGTVSVLPLGGLNCVPCRFYITLSVTCSSGSSCNNQGSYDQADLTCGSSERYSLYCEDDVDHVVAGALVACLECQ